MQITVIGAGIAGLTAAIALIRQGHDVKVYEAAEKFTFVGSGIWMAPNAMQVFDRLGIARKIAISGTELKKVIVTDHHGEPLQTGLMDEAIKKYGYAITAIHRAILHQALLSELPDGTVLNSKPFDRYEYKDGSIVAVFKDGSSAPADLLIGADGIHSKVRLQMLPTSSLRYSGQTCWRGVAEYKLRGTSSMLTQEMWGKGVRFGFSDIGNGKVYWFAVIKAKQGFKAPAEELTKYLPGCFEDFADPVKDLIRQTDHDHIIQTDLYDLKIIDKWYDDKVVLIGDAAHATTPNMGQGGAQGVEDCYYLAKVLQSHGVLNEQLKLFQSLRKPKADMIVKRSWTMGKIAHLKHLAPFRNFISRMIPSSASEKMMDKIYRID